MAFVTPRDRSYRPPKPPGGVVPWRHRRWFHAGSQRSRRDTCRVAPTDYHVASLTSSTFCAMRRCRRSRIGGLGSHAGLGILVNCRRRILHVARWRRAGARCVCCCRFPLPEWRANRRIDYTPPTASGLRRGVDPHPIPSPERGRGLNMWWCPSCRARAATGDRRWPIC